MTALALVRERGTFEALIGEPAAIGVFAVVTRGLAIATLRKRLG